VDLDAAREILRGLGAGEGDELGDPLELVGEEAADRRGGSAQAVGLDRDLVGQRRGAARERCPPPAAGRLLGTDRVGRLADDPSLGRGAGRDLQREAGRRAVQDQRPRGGLVSLGAEEGGQRDEIGRDGTG
jgi:hypothetical protein